MCGPLKRPASPRTWCGLDLIRSAPQIVHQHNRNLAPSPARRRCTTPPHNASLSNGRYFIFEVDPSSQQCRLACYTINAPSNYPTLVPNVLSDDVRSNFSVAHRSGGNPQAPNPSQTRDRVWSLVLPPWITFHLQRMSRSTAATLKLWMLRLFGYRLPPVIPDSQHLEAHGAIWRSFYSIRKPNSDTILGRFRNDVLPTDLYQSPLEHSVLERG